MHYLKTFYQFLIKKNNPLIKLTALPISLEDESESTDSKKHCYNASWHKKNLTSIRLYAFVLKGTILSESVAPITFVFWKCRRYHLTTTGIIIRHTFEDALSLYNVSQIAKTLGSPALHHQLQEAFQLLSSPYQIILALHLFSHRYHSIFKDWNWLWLLLKSINGFYQREWIIPPLVTLNKRRRLSHHLLPLIFGEDTSL